MLREDFFVDDYRPTKRLLNFRFVLRTMGELCMVLFPFLIIALLISLYYPHDTGTKPLAITAGVDAAVGLLLIFIGRDRDRSNIGSREGVMAVTISWFLVSIIGMLPYLFGGFISSVSGAFFEAMAGFTTTGGTVLEEVEQVPRSILFWRASTQWLGGLGIIAFLVAFVPMSGQRATTIFNNEATGVVHQKFDPHIGTMAKWLIVIYMSFTILCTLLFWAGPMTLYDAVCHAFACVSTGGFSTHSQSLGYFDSRYVELVAMIFMTISAIKFALIYFAIVRRQPSRLLEDSETRWYLSLLLIVSLIGGVWLWYSGYHRGGQAVFKSFFTIVSLGTSTSFFSGDYSEWGSFFGLLVLATIFVAGCSGSTSGGLKVVRFVVLAKNLSKELLRRVHPNVVTTIRMGNMLITDKVIVQVTSFFFAYTSLIILATAMVSAEGYALTDSISCAISCISNSGAALGVFGPHGGFSSLSGVSKIFLSLLMVMGRLEIFTVLSLFHPSYWRS
ncbi:potassium transporter TrkG [uncultured Porphyromonas sp.]|uniref:TrkH family potassium uptake protein n=1 Tax=uncultured Porphyromonas sp. TaxID=159274 RepID=UPI00261B37E1|nr:potassium transporter TrkG [uncultured Porphyromonas sp.]